jgi:hypothetical protein
MLEWHFCEFDHNGLPTSDFYVKKLQQQLPMISCTKKLNKNW